METVKGNRDDSIQGQASPNWPFITFISKKFDCFNHTYFYFRL